MISDVPKVAWIDLVTEDDLGTAGTPTLEQSLIVEAAVFYQETDDGQLYLGCAHSGSALYDPDTTSDMELDDLSEFVTCPGVPIDNDSADFHLY